MAIKRMPTGLFVERLEAAERRHDGYIMCATGQDPRKWAVDSWWYNQYSGKQRTKALYWREHAQRVWDCNGLSEGLYKDYAGKDINTRARYNYANWCGTKGTGMIPAKYRVPGAAVFWGNTASDIHHVAYLDKPVRDGVRDGDWYIIEARGVMHGVVKTKLYDRKPNYWGWMDKYFDYSENKEKAPAPEPEYQLGGRALKFGMSGSDVKLLQETLNTIGYELKADGVYGEATAKAVLHFKTAYGVKNSSGVVNDTYGTRAHEALMKVINDNEEPDKEPEKGEGANVRVIKPGTWNVRTGPGTEYGIVTIVKQGDVFGHVSTAPNFWMQIEICGTYGWLSPKCAEVTE